MPDDFDRVKDLYEWNRRILVVMGVWPLQSTYVTFAVWIVYLVIHMSMEFVDLYKVFGNLDLMILNLSETTLETMIILKLFVLRFSQTLVKVMNKIMKELDGMFSDSPEEKEIYLNYNRIAKKFFRVWFAMGCFASILYHMKPLEFRLRAGNCTEFLCKHVHIGPRRVKITFSKNGRVCFLYSVREVGTSHTSGITVAYNTSAVKCFSDECDFATLAKVLGNESMPFVLPYRTRLFFEVNDSATFWLVWICQCPMIYINMIHSMTIGYLFSLVLHVCGLLSVLAFRIKNLDRGLRESPHSSGIIFRELVERHRSIMDIAKAIDKVFNILLLEELLITTVILGLTAYTVLLNADLAEMTVVVSFLMYGTTMLLLIYGYCVAGEYLITESTNVYEAYYQCQWYDLSNTFKKQLLICIISASKPLQLTGGGFYVFSMASFASILKTSMGYVSMLRKMI